MKAEMDSQCVSPMQRANPSHPLLTPVLPAFMTQHGHDWFSTPMAAVRPKGIWFVWRKPKPDYYGCPISVIIRLTNRPADYGVAKSLAWGLNKKLWFSAWAPQTAGHVRRKLAQSGCQLEPAWRTHPQPLTEPC